jgi:hypothetical protein
MVAMTRAQIADPEWVNKVLGGRETELRRCIRGNQGCISRSFRGFPIGCTVNPAAGREAWLGSGTLLPASPPCRWLVIGGGPASMKAAEVAARRGHRVSLWERCDQLGGQVTLLTQSPGRARFGYLIEDLQRSLQRLGVDVRLGVEATADLVAADRPDTVVVATGAEPDCSGFSSIAPLVPRIPQADGAEVLTGWEVLGGTRRPRGSHVLLLDDLGDRYSAGVAETLLDQGFDVEFVTRLPSLFPALDTTLDLGEIYTRLVTKGMRYQVNRWARAITTDAVRLFDVFTQQESTAQPVSSVVLATSPRSNGQLHAELTGRVAAVHLIGDALAPRRLDHAIYEGEMAGRELFSDDRYLIEGDLEHFRPDD